MRRRKGLLLVWVAAAVLLATGFVPWAGADAADLVPNGSFEEGTAGWQFATTPAAKASVTVAPAGEGKCAEVQVVRNDTFTGWEIALQTALSESLDPSRLYRLRFTAASQEPGHVEFCVQQAAVPYRILHLAKAATGPEPLTLAVVLPRAADDSPMRLSVWFGNSPPGTYRVDDISIQPLSEEEVAALEQVPEGWTNGDFSAGLEGWELRVHDAAVATLALDPTPKLGDGNCARVDVTNATETGWHVQFMQIFDVQKDKTYVATFSAMADREVEITVSYQVPPPDNAGFGGSKVKLTTEPQTFSVKSDPITRDTPMKLSFHLSGAGKGTYWFDNVSVGPVAPEEGE